MYYVYHYQFEECYDVTCELCHRKIECINFSPEEEYPPQEEYRMFVAPLDDTSGELLRNIARRLSRLGYPWRESYILTMAWYLLGYQVKDLLRLISKGVHPLEIERIVFSLLKDEFRVYIAELVEHGLLDEEEAMLEIEIDSPHWASFLAQMRARNFTGEVRLGPPEEEEPQEKPISPEVQKMIDEALKWASSVKYARTGRYAYLFSQNCKSLLGQLPPEWAKVVSDLLKKAWEEWKSSHAKKK